MTNEELREIIAEQIGDEEESKDIVLFENPSFSDAVIGISVDQKLIYSYDKMIECLMRDDNMSYEEATEFIDYNTIRSLPYSTSLTGSTKTPIIMYNMVGLDT